MDLKRKERGCFLLGIAICFAVAGVSVLIERLVPGDLLGASIIALLLGASIIALLLGTIINSFFHPGWIKPALAVIWCMGLM